MKKVILVHGWGGDSSEGWLTPLRKLLESKSIKVIAENMPNSFKPKIGEWTAHLKKIAGTIDNDTYFIGHSIGCQAIMRFLEQLPKKMKVGGCIFVAGWFHLTDETWDETYTKEIAEPWINTPIKFDRIKEHTNRFLLILSNDDPYVPLSDSNLFKENLGAKIVIGKKQGHIEELNGKEIKAILGFIK
jgi:hypothetical protein